jgi:hypothetical protein
MQKPDPAHATFLWLLAPYLAFRDLFVMEGKEPTVTGTQPVDAVNLNLNYPGSIMQRMQYSSP